MLLSRLHEAGVGGKTWRILKDWYEGGQVQSEGRGKTLWGVSCGEGCEAGLSAVPHPLSIMDPLLKQLQASGLGLSLNNFYTGGSLHADDIRTLASSKKSLEAQAALVEGFATENFLTLNADQCEVVVFKRSRTADSQPCAVGGLTLSTGNAGKCLGFWWQSDLLVTRAITKNIKKARRAFFAYGSIGAF